ncbi:MAG: hypothetical protein AB7P69_06315 [Candidatus Binatia bacterium]
MKTALHSWASWLIIAIVILNTIGPSLPVSSLPPQPQDTTPSFVESSSGSVDRLFTKPASPAQEFSLRGEQQSKRFFLLSRVFHFTSYPPSSEDYLRQLADTGFFSFQLFFPRKIAPPSSSTDPFLS